MIDGLRELHEYNRSDLSPNKVSALSKAFGVSEAAIVSFRGGGSMAPAGHPRAGLSWYTIKIKRTPNTVYKTFWLDQNGAIMDKTEK